jgi:hypothetical protein
MQPNTTVRATRARVAARPISCDPERLLVFGNEVVAHEHAQQNFMFARPVQSIFSQLRLSPGDQFIFSRLLLVQRFEFECSSLQSTFFIRVRASGTDLQQGLRKANFRSFRKRRNALRASFRAAEHTRGA